MSVVLAPNQRRSSTDLVVGGRMTTVDWSALPPELLETIADNLKIHADYVRCRAVCRDWRDAIPATPKRLPCQLPWLMLPHRFASRQSHLRGFFSLSAEKIHFLSLPEASHRRRCGSSHGWLAILEESPAVFLLNPLTRKKINLPPLTTFPNVVNFSFYDVGREYTLETQEGDIYQCDLKEMRDSFIKKMIFSSCPGADTDSDFVAVAILNQTGDIAYCKQGDDSWNFIDEAQSYCEDVIYHNGLFYAVNKSGKVAVCDVFSGDSAKVSFIDTPALVGGDLQYLVGFGEDLLLVTRYLELEFDVDQHKLDILYKTTDFRVHRLNRREARWEMVERLDGLALFVGENSSLAFRASDFPGCKGDCIYFTDDYSERNYDGTGGVQDLGTYDMVNGTIADLPCYPRNAYAGRCWPPPIWVTPNPC